MHNYLKKMLMLHPVIFKPKDVTMSVEISTMQGVWSDTSETRIEALVLG
jgi:hypothetical protein